VSEKSATTIVLVTTGVLIGLALVTGPVGGKFKRAYAAAWLGVGLSFASDLAPGLTGPFAGAVLVGAVVAHPGVFGSITQGKGTAGILANETGASTQHPTRPGGESPGGPAR
jgi:hypothetical protein